MNGELEVEGGSSLELPKDAVEILDGRVVLHMDRLAEAVLAFPLPKLGRFIADDVSALSEVLGSLKAVALSVMREKKLKEIPLGDGRKLAVKASVSYNKSPDMARQLQGKLEDMGFVKGPDFPALVWEEEIPAKKVELVEDVPVLRKALALSGVTDEKEQNDLLGRSEGAPYLKVEGKKKTVEGSERIEAVKAGLAQESSDANPFSR